MRLLQTDDDFYEVYDVEGILIGISISLIVTLCFFLVICGICYRYSLCGCNSQSNVQNDEDPPSDYYDDDEENIFYADEIETTNQASLEIAAVVKD